jgi:UDP-2,3-diacylglucosamine pyrophosphatase LpxH
MNSTTAKKREIDLLVISDVHLGTYGCRADELVAYLQTIQPKTVVLNGDIIDIWQFSKRYFPSSHMKVIKHLTSLVSEGIPVYYITGNHDEMLRKFKGFKVGSFEIVNKVILELDGKKTWFFHGDVFDVTMKHSKWLAKLGGKGYDLLILINTFVNWISVRLGGEKLSFSKRIKDNVKSAVKFINNFEETVVAIASEQDYKTVVCGHIHQPIIKHFSTKSGMIQYLNSGDWVENCTSLEYTKGKWSLYRFSKDDEALKRHKETDKDQQENIPNNKELFGELLKEFSLHNHYTAN